MKSLRSIIEGLVDNGMIQRQIVDELNAAGIRTARGAEWKLVMLQRVLKQLDIQTGGARGMR